MKTTNKAFLLLIIVAASPNLTFAQSTTANNNVGSGNKFLGYNTNADLRFQIGGINFMTLKPTTGFLGIGLSTPQQLLHIHDGPAGTYTQYSNFATGALSSDGFLVGIASNGSADILQKESAPMRFYSSNTLRMVLNPGFVGGGPGALQPTINAVTFGNTAITVNTSGYFGIGFSGTSSPLGAGIGWGPMTLLHLQGPNNTTFQGANQAGGSGWRSWMKTGTYTVENTDAMYVGMKSEVLTGGANRSDAVINWSDDPTTGGGGPDVLRFTFTQFANSGLGNCTNCPLNPQGFEGMEIARMTAENGYGRMGVGPLFNAGLPPARRLEVHDGQTGNAQLRTSYALNANPNLGTWSDFQTTSIGDMYFNTRFNGVTRRFGFHDNTPDNTVEITSQPGVPYFGSAAGSSGLRFTNMTSANTPMANPGQGVLSVDAFGDVIYVPGGGGNTANNGVSAAGGVIQLGVPCNILGVPNIAGILAAALTADRVIPNFNQNLWIASLNTSTGGVGVGGQPNVNAFCNTGNTFEISANSKNPQYGSVDASGLRLTKLLSTSPTVANGVNGVNSAKVLTVDGDGDVVLTNAVSGFGAACFGGAPFNLSTHTRVGLNTFNLYFDGNFSGNKLMDNVVIGKNCVNPLAKLDVLQSSNDVGSVGINILNTDAADNANNIPVIGIKSVVNNPGFNCRKIAGWFEATPAPCAGAGVQYAVIVPPNGGYSGFGTTNPWATLHIVGSGLMNNSPIVSDANLKTDVQTLQNSLNKIRQLRGVSFNWIPSMRTDTFMHGTHLGFIAQEVDTVLPDVVRTSIDGTKTIEYNALIPITVQAIQQLDSSVTALQNAPAGISGSGTTNFLTKWSGASTVTSSQVFDNGTNVGIGTLSPANKLSVAGSSDFSGDMSVGETGSPANLFVTAQPFFGSGGIFVNNANSGNTLATLGMMDNENGVMRLYTSTPNFGGIRTEITSAASYFLGNVGIGTPSPTEKLHVAGNIFASGTITQNSDVRLKQNIAALSDGIEIINQLEPRTFNFDTAQYGWLNLPGGMQRGLVAQEVELLLPELITASFYPEVKDSAGNVIHPRVDYKGINYTALIPVLIRAVKEQQSKITQLESTVAGCCASNAPKFSEGLRSSDLELASKSAVLWQNFPNPFGDGTVIRYYVPETTASANIVFYDEFGNEIKNTGLPYKGEKAELNLSTLNLASGIYSYSLVVNGKIVDTKRMIRMK